MSIFSRKRDRWRHDEPEELTRDTGTPDGDLDEYSPSEGDNRRELEARISELSTKIADGDLKAARELLKPGVYQQLRDEATGYDDLLLDYINNLDGAFIAAQQLHYDAERSQLLGLYRESSSADITEALNASVAFYRKVAYSSPDVKDRLGRELEFSIDSNTMNPWLHAKIQRYCTMLVPQLSNEQEIYEHFEFTRRWEEENEFTNLFPDIWEHRVATLVVDPPIWLFPGREVHVGRIGGYLIAQQAAEFVENDDIVGIMMTLARYHASGHNRLVLADIFELLTFSANRLRPHLAIPND